jgi:ABC-type transporter Mla MlaB component
MDARRSLLPGTPILSVLLKGDNGVCTLALWGRLESRSAIGLQTEIDQLEYMSFDEMVIDVERLTGIDKTGASLLRSLCRYVSGKGRRVRFVGTDVERGDGSLAAAERVVEQLRHLRASTRRIPQVISQRSSKSQRPPKRRAQDPHLPPRSGLLCGD